MLAQSIVYTSGSRHPGHQFQPVAEAELHQWLPALARRLPGATRYGSTIVRELPGPYGVADLAVLIGGEKELVARLRAGLPPLLSEHDAAIVASLRPNRPTSGTDLANHLGYRVDWKRRISALVNLGAVAKRPTGYVRHPAFALAGSLHVIEAKTTNWSRGIEQSLAYAIWADFVTLVMGRLPRERHAATNRSLSLGLGLVENDRWINRPRNRNQPREMRQWTMEHLVAGLAPHHPSSSM